MISFFISSRIARELKREKREEKMFFKTQTTVSSVDGSCVLTEKSRMTTSSACWR
jgi:hypothetical protein